MSFRTQLTDTQLSFGSGSSIDLDDIPDGVQYSRLSNGTQIIYGSKDFAACAFSGSNLVIRQNAYFGTAQTGASYNYLYLGSYGARIGSIYGGIVIEPGGNKVFQIECNEITSAGSVLCLNRTGAASETTTVYFNSRLQYFKYNGGQGKFQFSTDVQVTGNLFGTRLIVPIGTMTPSNPSVGQLYFNAISSRLYIYNGTSWKNVMLT